MTTSVLFQCLRAAAGWVLFVLLAPLAWPLDRTQLAVIINTGDPLSVRIGEYYVAQRHIDFQNVIHVRFPPGEPALSREAFAAIESRVHARTLPHIQAYALTWAAPYRVDCMSITAAFAFGFDPAHCAQGCVGTRPSRYFDSPARLPFTQFGIRPTMAIAAASFESAKALIDRGVAADSSFPAGVAYLLSTADRPRSVRNATYALAAKLTHARVNSVLLAEDALRDARDVLFYFSGAALVPGLETLRFVPGAIADHLTSAGGNLTDSIQMSALRWLEAGATGSYGTVVEPCNLPGKFPFIPVVMARYVQGETLIEAYWKSVLMPGQGIFIGEPLAAPFRRTAPP